MLRRWKLKLAGIVVAAVTASTLSPCLPANAVTTWSANINFQPSGAPVPSGYLADSGSPYADRGNGYAYGWNVDSSGGTRDRDAPNSPDQRYDTLNHMQKFGDIVWEIAVPNGTYSVRIVAGDPLNFDQVNRIAAEGVLVVDGATSSGAPWVDGTQVVTVSDGKLTVATAAGSVNAKICFIDISAVPPTGNVPPFTPVITEPATDGQIVHPADVHMETAPFSDANAADTHVCTDWEIRVASSAEIVWQDPCDALNKVHVHLGDGSFVNSYAGRTELMYDSDYQLRARHKDSSGDPATEWSAWASRAFRTAPQPAPGTAVAWTLRQPGFQVDVVATGLTLPVNVAFVPNPGTKPTSPYYYVTELYGTVKVVSRDGAVTDYVRGVLNYRPSGIFPGSGEQGLTGIVVDPASRDVFVSMLYEAYANGPHYPKVVRFGSNETGSVAGSSQTILDMAGEEQGQSHQISNLSIGPDGKLYVHMGDGFETATAQNLDSYRGKILRMNLDGSPAADNPFYNASDGINARDYVFAYGFRNPFGGIWRASDGMHYEVENGPSVDRFAKIVAGRNYLWDGTDASMRNYAIYNWQPAVAPVNIAFVEPQTFGGSGFPQEKMGHAFVSESGATYGTGPQTYGKKISELVVDANGNLVSGPSTLIEYTGTGKATVAGLTAGPDGLYFTDLYKDLNYTAPTDPGANVLRIRYVGGTNIAPSVAITSPPNGATFTAPATIGIDAFASDSDGTIAKVEFFNGSTKLGEDTAAPYSFTWGSVGAGSYALTARATDDAGGSSTSTAVNVTVTTPGDFSISASPKSRSIRRGVSTSYTVSVSPSNGFTGNVALGVSGLPTGTSASFSPNPLSVSGSSAASAKLNVVVGSSSALGTFVLKITGSSGSLQHDTSVSLTVKS